MPGGDSRNPVEELAEAFVARYRRGERPAISEYVARYPQWASEIREVFPALVMLEQADDDLHRPGAPDAPLRGEAPPPLSQVGDFRIIREVGHGGMGVVYEAEQLSLGRRVAIKVLPKQLLANDAHRRRFEREARAAARLHHTNIVPVFGFGEQDGLHFYVMQFIQGLSLDQVLVELRNVRQMRSGNTAAQTPELPQGLEIGREHASGTCDVLELTRSLLTGHFAPTLIAVSDGSAGEDASFEVISPVAPVPAIPSRTAADTVSLRGGAHGTAPSTFPLLGQSATGVGTRGGDVYWQSVARIGCQVAAALQHAHEQGIVHRDVKPSNLLLDTHGNVWVTDFGLAKAEDQQDLTHPGDVLGTLRYMAPEQFTGRADVRSDVYSLGLTLYELLVMQPAFGESERARLIRQVLHETPPRLRLLDDRIPRDLETIVVKAIQRDPEQRYASAGELADDLQRFLDDEPIHARRVSLATRFRHWCRRNPAIAGLTTTIAVLLTAAAVVSGVAAVQFEDLATHNADLVVQANKDQRAAEQAQGKAEAAASAEKRLREEAERQTERANTNYARARRAVDAYLSKVTEEELLSVPGLQPLRQDLLAEALKFYSEFVQEQTDEPALQVELASAQYRLAIIQRELGDAAASQKANAGAIRLLETLRERGWGGEDASTTLARAYFLASRYDDCVRLCEETLKSISGNVEVRSTLAEAFNSLALGRLNKKSEADLAAALAYHEKAFAIRQQLVKEHPDNVAYNAELASTINNIGVLLEKQNKPAEKLAMFQLAESYMRKVCARAPHSVIWGRWLAIGYQNIARTQRELRRPQEALQAYQQHMAARQRLVVQNPAIAALRGDYYKALLELAEQQRQMGLSNEANRSSRDARDVLRNLPRETPVQKFELATVYAALAIPPDPNRELVADDPESGDERRRNADLALEVLQEAVDAGWADPVALKNNKDLGVLRDRQQFQRLLAEIDATAEANKLLAVNGTTGQAQLDNQQRAVQILEQASGKGPQYQKTLGATYHSIGVIQTGLKRFEEAAQSLREAVAIRQGVLEALKQGGADPSEQVEHFVALHQSHASRGDLAWAMGDHVEAFALWNNGTRELFSALAGAPNDQALQAAVASACFHLADRYGSIGLFDEAVRALQRGATPGMPRLPRYLSYSVVLAGAGADDDFDRYREFLDVKSAQAGQAGAVDAVRSDFLARSPVLDARVCELIVQTAIDAGGASRWRVLIKAFAQYLNRDYQAADRTLAEYVDAPWQCWYARAMVRHQLDDKEGAERFLEQGEEELRRLGRSLAERPETTVTLPHFARNWWEYSHFLATRRRAWELIHHRDPPEDPWLHLIQARGYYLIGENARADAEIDTASVGLRNDAELWLAVARLQAASQPEATTVDASFARAIELAQNDPLPLIQRGRWHAESGEQAKADADFARAASLAPQELHKFVEAGWWVVGPYPGELREFCPPELNPDPSIPVHIVDPVTGFSNQPVKWTPVGSDKSGIVELAGFPEGSVYALSLVYSPDERSVMLVMEKLGEGAEPQQRVWANGQLALPADDNGAWQLGRKHVNYPIRLFAGRNALLIKAPSRPGRFVARLGDHPLDRGMHLGRLGLFREAAESIDRACRDVPQWRESPRNFAALYALAAGNRGLYETVESEHHALVQNVTGAEYGMHLSWLFNLGPLRDVDPQRMVHWVDEWQTKLNPPPDFWAWRVYGLAKYRAGRYEEARTSLTQHPALISAPHCRPILAMTLHQLGRRDEARDYLRLAEDWLKNVLENYRSDGGDYLAEFIPPFREAQQLIEGDTSDVDARLEAFFERRRELWNERDRLIAAFDDAVTSAGDDHRAYLARGRRLAELGRFSQAEADFNKAVELAPNNSDVSAARAAFYADRGDVSRAADDFWSALNSPSDGDWLINKRELESQVQNREEVGFELLRRWADNSALHRLRGERLARLGQWEQARDAYSTGMDFWSHAAASAALSVLLNDSRGFDAGRLRMRQLLDASATSPAGRMPDEVFLECLQPPATERAVQLIQDLRSVITAPARGRLDQMALGAAHYRAGEYEAALTSLQSGVSRQPGWQMDAPFWPLISMAHWQLGQQDQARLALNRSSLSLKVAHEATHRLGRFGGTLTYDIYWMYALALHREAQTLIQGQEFALAEFARLTEPPASSAAPQPETPASRPE